MDIHTTRYLLIFLLALSAQGKDTTSNDTSSDEFRSPRSRGRTVKLYSGKKPEPILCSGEGFQADSNDCSVFYRCVKSGKGKYSVFRFQCGPGTVYDPETEVCNHPQNTKRAECGGLKGPSVDITYNDGNEIEEVQQELPTPISTKLPVYTERTTTTTSFIIAQSSSEKPSFANVDPSETSTKRQEFYDNTSSTTVSTKYQENSSVLTSTSQPQLSSSVNKQSTSSDTICTSDGFIGDSEHCHKFYRCVRNQKGGYTKYEFSCSESTIWDDDIQACNHPWAVKRSRCGRSSVYDKNYTIPNTINIARETTTQTNLVAHDLNDNTIQQQLQISYGSKVTQNQIQISKGPAIQNQTQINYGDKVNKTEYSPVHQNQTQISYGSAVSQVQTQINHENEVVQTQLQIDHMKETSQTQIQIQESSTIKNNVINTDDNVCTESGFMSDSNDCKKFYRCVNNGRGSFTRHEFSCGEGTVWDSNMEACNHAWLVKECGRRIPSSTATHEVSSTSTIKSTQSNDIVTTKTSHNHYTTSEVTPTKDFEDVGYGSQSQDTTISAINTTNTTPDITKIEENECKSSGFMGDTKDCKIFYRCVENGKGGYTKYEFKCGEGTVWDSDIEGCNHEWAVKKCGGSASINNETTKSTTTTTPTFTTNSNSQPTEQIVQHDDFDTGYNSHEDTFVSTTIKTTKQPQDSNNNESNECQSSGFMGDEKDCKKFYRCVDNDNGSYTRYEFTCGEGTVWDPKIQACNHAWAVEHCGTSYPTPTGDEFSHHNVTTAHEDTGVSFSTQSEVNADTTTINSLTSTTTVQTIISTDGSKCSTDGFIGDNKDCKKFYRCVDNGDGSYTRHEFVCGDGTVWDQHIGACNHPWAVEKCGNINETTEHVTTSQTSPIMNDEEIADGYPMPEDDIVSQTTQSTLVSSTTEMSSNSLNEQHSCKSSGFFGDSLNCKKFYRCVDDGKGGFIQYEFQCGEGTVWDQSIEACNHEWIVKTCGNGSNTTSSQTESTTPSGSTIITEKTTISPPNYPSNENAANCEQAGFFGVKNDCKKFYRCVENGDGGFVKHEFSCGEGTYWNQNIIACDHASPNQSCGENESTTKEPEHLNDEMFTGTTSKTTTLSVTVGGEEASSIETSQHNICQSDGFHSDSNDCKKFYRCVDNGIGSYTKYDFTCGDGTVWNQEILACDHISSNNQCVPVYSSTEISGSQQGNKENYTTEFTTITQEQQSTEKTDTVTSSGNNRCKSEGFYADSSDCKKFIRCVSNHNGGYTEYEFACGEGTIWVQDIQACDHDNGDESCSIEKNNDTTQAQTTESQQLFTTSETIFGTSTSHPQTPDKENDEFDNENSKEPEISRQNCSSEGFYANENDCKQFYRCVDNNNGGYTRYDFICGEGTAWDGEVQACNHISQVESCNHSSNQDSQVQPIMHDEEVSQTTENTSTTKPSTSSESNDNASSTQDACKYEGYYGNTENCKLFYRCVDDGKGGFTKYDYSCGDGTIWDQDITACNHPQDVVNPSCNQEQAETSTLSSSSSSPTTSSTSSSEISQSTTQSTTQSSGQASQNCTQMESSSKPENKNITCNKAGFYPDPNDCKKFYRCVDWDNDGNRFSVYYFECGEGTIWDPAVETCNHEESVYPPRDCSGAQSQNENMESTTTEKLTTLLSTTDEETATSQQPTTQETTTSQSPVTEETTDQHSTSTETSTTQQSSTNEQTTTQQSSTSPQTTTQQSTSTEISTTQQSSTSEQTTTQQSTTSDQTTQQSSTSTQSTSTEKSTTQQSSTSQLTTTEQSSSSEQTTTQTSTTNEQTSVKPSTSTDQTTTEQTTQSTDSGGGTTTDEPMTTESSAATEGTTTDSHTTSQQTTTDHASTDNNSSTETTTTEAPTATTTQSSETSSTTENHQETTTNETSTSECPDTDSDQNLFVCPTSFRRHPKYCNVFYQCTEEDESHDAKIAVFTCPNNTIYDESKTQCVEEDKAEKPCKGEIATRRRFKRVGVNFKEPIIVTRDRQVCSSVGHMPFEKNSECSPAFLKCETTKSGKLRGFVYQCPKGYIYWSISKRCEQIHNVINCKRTTNNWNNRWEIPIERSNVAW